MRKERLVVCAKVRSCALTDSSGLRMLAQVVPSMHRGREGDTWSIDEFAS